MPNSCLARVISAVLLWTFWSVATAAAGPLVFNTTAGKREVSDSFSIRRETLMKGLPYFTTMTGARAAVGAMEAAKGGRTGVRSLQEYHAPER